MKNSNEENAQKLITLFYEKLHNKALIYKTPRNGNQSNIELRIEHNSSLLTSIEEVRNFRRNIKRWCGDCFLAQELRIVHNPNAVQNDTPYYLSISPEDIPMLIENMELQSKIIN